MKNVFESAEAHAMENFSNYSGSEWNYFDDPYNYADGNGSSVPEASSIPYVINVQNTTTTNAADVVILGSNAATANATANAALGVVLTLNNGSVTYAQFLESIKSQPFNVGLMYLQSSNSSQPFQSLTVTHQEANGRQVTQPVMPALDPMQNQSGVTIVRYQFPVNAFTSISTTILASATLTMRLYASEVLDISRPLSGQSVGKGYVRPNLSQFQLPVNRGLVG